MSVSWPDAFPDATIQGYSLSPDESIARTAMEAGVARQRRRFTSVPTSVRVRWLMDSSTFGLFESWYLHKAKAGAEWITIDLANGLGYTSSQARFLKPYSAKVLSDDLWEVDSDLEVREMTALTEGALDIILTSGFGSAESLQRGANELHALVHTTLSTVNTW